MSYKMNDTVLFDSDGPGNIATFSKVIVGVHHAPPSDTSHGYTSGGLADPPGYVTATIERFSFASAANSTTYGSLNKNVSNVTGHSSSTHGYTTGGINNQPPFSYPFASPLQHPTGRKNYIYKFLFGTGSDASDIGDLINSPVSSAGQSSSTHGYVSGGDGPPVLNTIQKFPFSTDANSTDIADLTQARVYATGVSSSTHGYTAGGMPNDSPLFGTKVNTIDKFPFSSDDNATDVGDLNSNRAFGAGANSGSHGYVTGGYAYPNAYEPSTARFPFSSDTNATVVGAIGTGFGTWGGPIAGHSSPTHGYTSGGGQSTSFTHITRFSFAVEDDGAEIGDLQLRRFAAGGHQG